MRVYLFFNYSRAEALPPHDYWINFKNPDSTKLAFFAAESWRRLGWQVERMSSARVSPGFQFTGRCREACKLYAVEFWNFWFEAHDLAHLASAVHREPEGLAWFTTTDVFNYGFTPALAADLARRLAEGKAPGEPMAAAFMAQHWSNAAFCANTAYCLQAIETIKRYDRGELPALEADLVSDETILRAYCPGQVEPLARYALAEAGWSSAPMLHFPRSCLQHFDGYYPAA